MQAKGDDFLGGALSIAQPEKGFRSGQDAVLLAASIPAKSGEFCLELGAGAGVASLCLAHRVRGCSVYGLEIDEGLVGLAGENAKQNGLQGVVRFFRADITEKLSSFPTLEPERFDHVFANPPFYNEAEFAKAPNAGRALARSLPEGGLSDWVRVACALVRSGGSVSFIYPARFVLRLLPLVEEKLGNIILFPLFAKEGAEAKLMLIRAIRDSKAPLQWKRGAVIHQSDNKHTPTLNAILRQGQGLVF